MNHRSIVTERAARFVTAHFRALIAFVIVAAIVSAEAVYFWPLIILMRVVFWP